LKSFIPLLVNAPVFISFFIALRKMAELPVCSYPLPGSTPACRNVDPQLTPPFPFLDIFIHRWRACRRVACSGSAI
jgi:hypothetical protein